jgi:hypothetical protein
MPCGEFLGAGYAACHGTGAAAEIVVAILMRWNECAGSDKDLTTCTRLKMVTGTEIEGLTMPKRRYAVPGSQPVNHCSALIGRPDLCLCDWLSHSSTYGILALLPRWQL